LEDGLTAKLSLKACEYCVDGDGNWKSLPADTETEAVNSGHTLSFRGNLTPHYANGIGTFTINKFHNLKGNCMSMLFGDDAANHNSLVGYDYAFCKLFNGCTGIVEVSNNFLPATELAIFCYRGMFEDCTSLVNAPALPATTLSTYCYGNMFRGCTSLVNTPELPTTTLTSSCYANMFESCTSLVNTPELPATTLTSSCYAGMFDGCTSLVNAPALPATELVIGCYSHMFNGCSNLNYVKALFTTTPSSDYTYYWLNGVSETGTFVKNANATWDVTGVDGVPEGWTVETV
jgi:hypothetical protein